MNAPSAVTEPPNLTFTKRTPTACYGRRCTRRKARHRAPRALRQIKAQRRIFVVDIENLVGRAVRIGTDVQWTRELLTVVADLRMHDQVVIGTSHVGLLEIGVNWPDARIVVRSGKNGADYALLDVLRDEQIRSRFAEVVLVSGDGIFAETVTHLTEDGVKVTVVANSRALSNALRAAASGVIELPNRQCSAVTNAASLLKTMRSSRNRTTDASLRLLPGDQSHR